MTDRTCHEVQALIPELALGVAPGPERARALAHVATCDRCRERLDSTSQTVDELMLLAPQVEPPAGFETRVLQSLQEPQRRVRRSVVALAVAACLLVAATAGIAVAWSSPSGETTALRSADLTMTAGPSVGSTAGHVFAYEGQPGWVFMTVDGVPSHRYRVTVVSENGDEWDAGVCRVRDGYESWGTTVDVPVSTIDRVEMSSTTEVSFTADFD